MENTTKYKVAITIFLIALLILGQKYKQSIQKNKSLENRNSYLTNQVEDYTDALQEANDNIDEANSSIEDAQGYAWSSYEEMGEALENLYTVNTVSSPRGIFIFR